MNYIVLLVILCCIGIGRLSKQWAVVRDTQLLEASLRDVIMMEFQVGGMVFPWNLNFQRVFCNQESSARRVAAALFVGPLLFLNQRFFSEGPWTVCRRIWVPDTQKVPVHQSQFTRRVSKIWSAIPWTSKFE